MRAVPFVVRRQVEAAYAPVSDVRPLLSFFFAVFFGIALISRTRGLPDFELWRRTGGFLFLLVLVYLVGWFSLTRGGRILLDPFLPSSFYPLFFAAYYLLPFSVLILDPNVAGVRFLEIGAAMLVAFASFQFGCHVLTTTSGQRALPEAIESKTLLFTCWACMAGIAVLYYWRLKNGVFYTHAANYEVGTDSASSLLESFVLQLHLPTVILCGLVAASPGTINRRARLSLRIFVGFSLLLFLATSQFRLAASVLILGRVSRHLLRNFPVDWKTTLKLAAFCTMFLILIFVMRASDAGTALAQSENQLTDLVRGVAEGRFTDASQLEHATLSSESSSSRGRATAALLFFNDVVEVLDSGDAPFGRGRSLVYETSEIIPRVFWRDKPVFLSTQIFIRQELGMSSIDSSPHPLLQFYYEFGWIGIAAGFFLMGLGITWVTQNLRSVFMWTVFAFTWSALIQVEVGLFLNLLVTLRAAVLVFLLSQAIHFVIRTASRPAYGRSTAIATAFPPPRHSAATPLREPRRTIS